ncbi:hypothetical protein ABPG72_020075 [Tetrahymena utriculariae]
MNQQVVTPSCVSKLWNQWQQEGKESNSYSNCGRNQMEEEDKQAIVDAFKSEVGLSLRKAMIDEEVNPNQYSHVTIKRVLDDEGIKSYKIKSKISLTDIQKEARVQFCMKKRLWTQKWNQIWFSDESHIFPQSAGYRHFWSTRDEKPENQGLMVNEKTSYPLKVSVFGIIGHDGPKKLIQYEGNLDSLKYLKLIEELLLNEQQVLDGSKILMQDGAKCHTSLMTLNKLSEWGINVLKGWPAKSPDLNPIENVWSIIKDEVWIEHSKQAFDNKEDLYDFVSNCYFNNERVLKTIKNSYSSMQKRMVQVIEKQGDTIDY